MKKVVPTSAEVRAKLLKSFLRIGSGTKAESKVGRIEFEKITHDVARDSRRVVFVKSFVEILLGQVRSASDSACRARLLSSLTRIVWASGKPLRPLFLDLAFEEVLHSDARVRLAAVHMADYLRMDLFISDEHTREGMWGQTVSRIVRLINERAPTDWKGRDEHDPVYVRALPASELKSLLFMWRACAYTGAESEKWLERNPGCNLGFPVEWWEDGSMRDEVEELPTREEVENDLWENGTVTNAARRAFSDLSEMVHMRFRNALKDLKILDQKMERLIDTLRTREDLHLIDEILLHGHALNQAKGRGPEAMNGVVRALQGFANHTERKNSDGDPVSYLTITCLRTRNDFGRSEPRDMGPIVVLLRDAHAEIDAMCETILTRKRAENNELFEWLKKHFPEDSGESHESRESDYRTSFVPRVEDCRSIARHVLDWYAALEPWRLHSKNAKKWAATALDIVRWANEDPERNTWHWMPYDRKVLGTFGGWKGTIGYGAHGAWAAVRDGVEDPDLLVLPPDDIDRDLEKDMGNAPKQRETRDDPRLLDMIDIPPNASMIGTHPSMLTRSELMMRLSLLFDRYHISSGKLQEVERWVYEEGGNELSATQRFHEKFMALFPPHAMADEVTRFEVMGTSVDAWNAFPHKSLGGKSPLEMMSEQK